MKAVAHQLTENVKLLQKAAIFHGDKVLLLKRAMDAKSRPGGWDLPGGNSEWPSGESRPGLHRDDIARETLEETGINIAPKEFSFEKLLMFETYFDKETDIFSILAIWRIDLPSDEPLPEVTLSDEHTESLWMDYREAATLDYGGGMGNYIRDHISLDSLSKN